MSKRSARLPKLAKVPRIKLEPIPRLDDLPRRSQAYRVPAKLPPWRSNATRQP